MYSDLSNTWKYLNRGVTSLAWVATGAVGVWVALAPPETIIGRQELWVSIAWCALTMVGSFFGLIGELRGHYWTQLVGSLVATAGLSAYVLTVWALVAEGGPTRGAQASALTALILFTLRQAALCGAQAYRVRRIHETIPEV